MGDEVGASLDEQVAAVSRTGWRGLELRRVDGRWVADLPIDACAAIGERFREAGLELPCLCSRIGGWAGRTIEEDRAELQALAARRSALGLRTVRVMSFVDLSEGSLREVAARMRALVEVAEGEGLVLLHENCVGWAGGDRPERVMELIAEIGSPALRVLFDVGNGIAYRYDSVALLEQVLPYVEHVHLKDGTMTAEGEVRWTMPGAGDARAGECLTRLAAARYDGWVSCEPHLFGEVHRGAQPELEHVRDTFLAYAEAAETVVGGARV